MSFILKIEKKIPDPLKFCSDSRIFLHVLTMPNIQLEYTLAIEQLADKLTRMQAHGFSLLLKSWSGEIKTYKIQKILITRMTQGPLTL